MPDHRKATVKQLARKIKDYPRRFAFFLGAGASAESGILTASGMIRAFKRQILEDECPDCFKTDEEKENWLAIQEWYDVNNSYGSLFEHCERNEIGRQRYIERLIEGRKPSLGYATLAYLLATEHINTIITTNFDDLIYTACTTFTDIRPIVFAYGILASEMRVSSTRPKILKLHGDFLYSALKNTGDETRAQDPNMARQVAQILNEYGLIVVGYSGGDKSVMDILDQISEKNDLYWCIHRGDELNNRAKGLLESKKGFPVEIEGFDEMMDETREIVGFDVGAMLGSVQQRQVDIINQLASTTPRSKLLRVSSQISEALEKMTVWQQGWEKQGKAWNHFVLALDAEDKGNPGEAAEEYNKAIHLAPDYPAAHYNLGLLLARDNMQRKDAEKQFRTTIDLDPEHVEAYYHLGLLLQDDKTRDDEAEAAFRKVIRLAPNATEGHISLGNLLAKEAARVSEAESEFRRAIELAPKKADSIAALAFFLRMRERFAEAESFYRRALELDDKNPIRYLGLAILLQQTSRYSEALPFAESGLALAPNVADLCIKVAALCKKLDRLEEATRYAETARPLVKGNDWEKYYTLACIESVEGNVNAAIDDLRRAAEDKEFDRDWSKRDPDLEWIRDDPRFKEIVGA